MNTLMKMFSVCLCFCTLVFASADIKTGEKLIKADESKGLIGKTVVSESSSRGVCDESFSVTGYGDLNGNGSLELCYTDGTGFFNFAWDGGCVAQTLTLSDGVEQDLSTYAFNAGFFYFGFENGLTEEVIITFAPKTASLPICVPSTITHLDPINALFSIITGAACKGSKTPPIPTPPLK